ncbi:lipoprotein [Desulfovibrio psychrotolerans]|uniref:Lipoprotein n=1 Tax=Desulfovibrio psychrotolerans TaxID=415242 RepID=A0A7J0BYB6_9BACT|nr:lipoprotein [Desulfovibrio psychrotolerans]
MTKRAVPLLIILTALGSGCAVRPVPVVPPAPVVLRTVLCPAPVRPVLPSVNGNLPFDAPENLTVLLERDDTYRAYAEGLEAAVECYSAQTEND